MRFVEIRIDGYKNLIGCRVPLRDFNVLVGPNNVGKSNLLEFSSILRSLLFASRLTSPAGSGNERRILATIPHVAQWQGTSLTVGLTLEFDYKSSTWRFNYDASVNRSEDETECITFGTETLSGKKTSVTGPPKKYFEREGKSLHFLGKEMCIAEDASAINLIFSSSTETAEHEREFGTALTGLVVLAAGGAVSISPQVLRRNLGSNTDSPLFDRSSCDILRLLDELQNKKETFESFREAVCEIMGFEDIMLQVAELGPPSAEGEAERKKRIRSCFIKQYGRYSPLEEFSDGTLSVVAVVAMVESSEIFPLLLLEEPENSLHPAAVAKLMRFLKENSPRRPVLITTHSPYLLNGVDPEDVIVAVAEDSGAAHFEKPTNRKAINELLKRGYMSFGDLLVTNFKDVM